MYNISKVINAFNGLVGWKQPVDPDFAIVSIDNQNSSSGRFYTDNSMIKIRFIRDTQDYIDISDVEFNSLLKEINDQSLINVMDSVFNDPDFIDRQLLYKNANNKVSTYSLPDDNFVGYEIKMTKENNYAFEINSVILEFDNVGSDIEILLYNSFSRESINSKTITVTDRYQVEDLNWIIDNSDGFYKGNYYIGFRTQGVALLPIKRDYENSDMKSSVTGLSIQNIKAPQSGSDLFDLDDITNEDESWGLNLDITVYKDYTDSIIRMKKLFANALQLQGQIKVIEGYLSSIRSNREERISADRINAFMVELEGVNTDTWKKKGLKSELFGEITRIKEELNKIKDGYLNNNRIYKVTRC